MRLLATSRMHIAGSRDSTTQTRCVHMHGPDPHLTLDPNPHLTLDPNPHLTLDPNPHPTLDPGPYP